MRRRKLVTALGTALVGGVAGCTGSSEPTADAFAVASPELDAGGSLPTRFTCYGAGVSPPFSVERVPDPTAALAVVAEYDSGGVTDPLFWTLWNVPPDTDRIPAGLSRSASVAALGGARQGRREGGDVGYEPPCPQPGQPYTNRFQVYALGERLDVEGGTDHDTASEAIGNAVLASRRITVDFERTPTP
ncbi:YbhB/YbcL family Raf kinase inhibitor-like protein [Haloarcula onubensis]|uniref:YbhB/YbcL family Raf kinase inhibitor-like protein n=1 Tax=Haloarcula onubensis TaxID=2950539 RepID=A0ABU2FTY0_9EURY|nr:YbhB/YbcL family Raf kinase inhibitor-like protein [Halomicroarcula sp. S3CR25-11]MDS0284208.1 YbhB/YbcL family Raf kinase inhibitor-like protein [Halomicroarcula sp. S3CR25-11]